MQQQVKCTYEKGKHTKKAKKGWSLLDLERPFTRVPRSIYHISSYRSPHKYVCVIRERWKKKPKQTFTRKFLLLSVPNVSHRLFSLTLSRSHSVHFRYLPSSTFTLRFEEEKISLSLSLSLSLSTSLIGSSPPRVIHLALLRSLGGTLISSLRQT